MEPVRSRRAGWCDRSACCIAAQHRHCNCIRRATRRRFGHSHGRRFLISALGGSRVQIGGPTGAFIGVVYAVIHEHGYDGLLLFTLIAGLILLIAGLLRAGRLADCDSLDDERAASLARAFESSQSGLGSAVRDRTSYGVGRPYCRHRGRDDGRACAQNVARRNRSAALASPFRWGGEKREE